MEANVKQTRLYCQKSTGHKGNKYYANFFPSIMQVRMCQDARHPEPILSCLVTEAKETPDSYWAWWDEKDQRFTMIFHGRPLLECCFPYGSKIEEEHGKGKVTPVAITLIP